MHHGPSNDSLLRPDFSTSLGLNTTDYGVVYPHHTSYWRICETYRKPQRACLVDMCISKPRTEKGFQCRSGGDSVFIVGKFIARRRRRHNPEVRDSGYNVVREVVRSVTIDEVSCVPALKYVLPIPQFGGH
jgi:hypothetical protein